MARRPRYDRSGVYRLSRAEVTGCPPDGTGTCLKDPIPPGIYWIDAIGDEAIQHLSGWLTLFSPILEVIRSEEKKPGLLSGEKYLWVLVEVKAPVARWSRNDMVSMPTVGTRDMQQGDTVQKPPPEKSPLEGLWPEEGISPWVWAGAGVALTLGLVVYLR